MVTSIFIDFQLFSFLSRIIPGCRKLYKAIHNGDVSLLLRVRVEYYWYKYLVVYFIYKFEKFKVLIYLLLLTVSWLVLSEIFPAAIKGRAIAITTILNWGTNLIISSVFLDMMGKFC